LAQPEAPELQAKIIRAVELSRRLRIFTYLQLLMFLFVLFCDSVGKKARRFARHAQTSLARYAQASFARYEQASLA
jgi:hypothetical protein